MLSVKQTPVPNTQIVLKEYDLHIKIIDEEGREETDDLKGIKSDQIRILAHPDESPMLVDDKNNIIPSHSAQDENTGIFKFHMFLPNLSEWSIKLVVTI